MLTRLDSSVRAVWRRAAEDTAVGGQPVRAGQRLYCAIAAANRDDVQFPRADDYRPARPNSRTHLSFGRGPHVCIGAALSRVRGFELLQERFGGCPVARLEVSREGIGRQAAHGRLGIAKQAKQHVADAVVPLRFERTHRGDAG